jgi:hypothetical protein
MNSRIDLVENVGLPPVTFGMTSTEAVEAASVWGELKSTDRTPGGVTRLRVGNEIYINLEKADRVTSIEIWHPEPSDVVVSFRSIDVFGNLADDVLESLSQLGFRVDTSDPHFPIVPEIALGFNRSGGDDPDDDGRSWSFRSVLIGPPGYYG